MRFSVTAASAEADEGHLIYKRSRDAAMYFDK